MSVQRLWGVADPISGLVLKASCCCMLFVPIMFVPIITLLKDRWVHVCPATYRHHHGHAMEVKKGVWWGRSVCWQGKGGPGLCVYARGLCSFRLSGVVIPTFGGWIGQSVA